MGLFDKHFLMDDEHVLLYVREKLKFFSSTEELICENLTDGNINYVFRIKSLNTGKSVIVKHADLRTRSKASEVSLDRVRIESEALKLQKQLAEGFVPIVYYIDTVMGCIVMQDLYDYKNFRYQLCERKQHQAFADDIIAFLSRTLIRSSDLVMRPVEKRELVRKFTNPSMCAISERKVFNDPCLDYSKRNRLYPPLAEFLQTSLYKDEDLCLEAAFLKEKFKNCTQSLIHGDLHTGSILVKEGSTMVLDPEFAVYGPMGYDVGNVIANLIMAYVSAYYDMEKGEPKNTHLTYLLNTIMKIVDGFKLKAIEIINNEKTEPMITSDAFISRYMFDVMSDIAGFAGMEIIRRIVGSAKVLDLTMLTDEGKRISAEKACIYVAKQLVKHNREYQTGVSYLQIINEFVI